MKQPDPSDHRETDLGTCAAVSDRGHRHHRNEDAYGIDTRDGVTVAVVCDGVSQSASPEKASAAAADAALGELRRAFDAPLDAQATSLLLRAAVARAQDAAAALASPTDSTTPATTLVAAVVAARSVTVANVGDSRGYWLGSAEQSGQALTVDDSMAEDAIAAGTAPADAYAAADAHTITAWLGRDAGAVVPRLTTAELPHAGLVLLCSDGMWNHYEEASQLIELVEQDNDHRPIAIAQRMVSAALDAGGEDNITVAVIPAGPPASITTSEESPADGDVHA
jgi:serine/threonine protein phosphatase PrpC